MSASDEYRSPWVVDTTAEQFELDVVERSKVTPVVVDFWAPWCQPCRLLAPLLEKLVDQFGGQFVLVRANTDELPQIAGRFQVQSIPAVFAFVNGDVVDFFQGLLPEQQLRGWVEQILLTRSLAEARAMGVQPAESARLYRQLMEQLPNHSAAAIGLARVLLTQGQTEAARELIDELEKRGFLEPEAEKVQAALDLQARGTGDLAEYRVAAEAEPDNLERQLKLAEALAGQHQYEEALERCLQLVEKDKQGLGESARQVMVGIFHVLPDDSELTRNYRRKLSALLF